MIFATDLDRTLIHSKRFYRDDLDLICVEEIRNKEISYMTRKSYKKFLKLQDNIKIVPVTTRSIKQYKRIKMLSGCKYAITTNGGVILKRNKKYIPWEKEIHRRLCKYKKEYIEVMKMLDTHRKYIKQDIKKIDKVYLYTKIRKEYQITLEKILDKNLNKDKWYYVIQSNKLYIIPKVINKESALIYLINELGGDKLITAGDGELDIGFIGEGDIRIIPEGSHITGKVGYKHMSTKGGLVGTIEILNIVWDKGCSK